MENKERSFLDDVKAAVADILIGHKAVRENLQGLLIKLTIHVEQHGDITGVQYLVDRLGSDDAKGINNRAVADWLKAFSKVDIKYDRNDKRNIVMFARSKVTKLDDGKAKPWYEFRPSKIQEGYNFREVLEMALTKANNQLKRKAKLIEEGKEKEASEILVTKDEVTALRLMLHPESAPKADNSVTINGRVEQVEDIEITQLPQADAA